ncbi:ferredoxin reductase family protein [Leptolyngbya sp. AN03gr2]|uniref:ferredoxin reductase family protein n=1 Tax=unclassified Leptolyngbya TaxID=2650499 RepID=UPI003D313E6F
MRSLLMPSPVVIALGWIIAFLFFTVLPLLVLLIYPPSGRGFWLDFSAALGFISLALMVLQFVLTARVKWIEASYGIDLILGFHRYSAFIAFILVLVHPIVLFWAQPDTIQLLDFSAAPWRARAALLATLAFIVLIVTTIWRKQLRIPYEPWRFSHSVLSLLTVGLGLGHALAVSNYLELFWKAVLWDAMALIALLLVIYIRLVRPWLMLGKSYLIESVLPEAGHVSTLILRSSGHEGFRFQPGQFVWITLGTNPFRMQEHPFSIASSAEHPEKLEFGIKAVGDFTTRIKACKPGMKAYLDGPYGVFTPDRYEDAAGFVLIAGGIGITPMMSMLVTAAERRDDRPYTLIYANRTWDEIPYRSSIEDLKTQLELTVIYVLREPPTDWKGETGYIDAPMLDRHIPQQRGTRHYFICATAKMMNQIERSLHELDVPITNVHLEHFNLA